ncbi:helix-turn-helix transcriptional regulator [Streptomyces sp. Y7]|uniref:helix-turn-helix domain-containing protein n=1 Tax=Streptomyces sp. Y7 TaxID=3342392 RepID=UPI003722064D
MTTGNKSLRRLAEWLREQRGHLGHSYRQLAGRTEYDPTTLSRAASGNTVPLRDVVRAYAEACYASVETADRLWLQARREQQTRSGRKGQHRPAPRPELIHDRRDLAAALHDLWERAGAPSTREMQKRAGNYSELPHSTAHRILTKQTLPRHDHQLEGFLCACEVPETEWPQWLEAWRSVLRHEHRLSSPPVRPHRQEPGDRADARRAVEEYARMTGEDPAMWTG